MSKVKILPDIIINKIAAGEVVERPASIVKELVENSLDAGSSRIFVDIEDGGKRLIKISDNGEGMDYEDALLAIERHATSKIISDADLFSISTLGFRGEALPSIASISRFSLETKTKNADAGVTININGGRILNVEDCGCAPGTVISVKDIFFNTPARRKFLKTSATELAHITEILTCLALPWPSVHFRLSADGRVVKNMPAVVSPVERAVDVVGRDMRNRMLYVERENENVTLSGWISEPDVSRGSGQKIYIFVNGRYVRDRGIIHAICDAYSGSLMKGRFPLAVLFMDLPDGTVDVNVHPAKQEVRFTNHRDIYGSVRVACHDTLMKREVSRQVFQKPIGGFISSKKPLKAYEPPVFRKIEPESGVADTKIKNSTSLSSNSGADFFSLKPDESGEKINSGFSGKGVQETTLVFKNSYDIDDHPDEIPSIFKTLKIIGQSRNAYIICDSSSGLVIFDQHAAHERVVFEKLEKMLENEKKPSVQRLLIPEIIEFSPRETIVMLDILPELASAGIEMEHFGENSFAVRAVPALLSEIRVKELLNDMAETMTQISVNQPNKNNIYKECFSVMACHSAIRSGQELAVADMKNLLEDLSRCGNPYHCPHGRPVYMLVSGDEMEKKFRRKG